MGYRHSPAAFPSGIPQRQSDVAANITIITADQIRQTGGRSIPQVLARVPGLDIFQSSLNSFDVGVRGYQTAFQPRLLVLIDGRQVFIDDYSRTIWDNLPVNIDDIRQIEVVKGAASALSGPNAAGGVINIVTYSPLYDNITVGSVGAGSGPEPDLLFQSETLPPDLQAVSRRPIHPGCPILLPRPRPRPQP